MKHAGSSAIPGMDALIRDVAEGRLRGTAAFDAIVDHIARHETPAGASAALRREIHDDVVLVVSQDRDLCKLVFADATPKPAPPTPKRKAKAKAKPAAAPTKSKSKSKSKSAKAAAKKRRLQDALPPEDSATAIGPPPLTDEEIDAELEAIEREREARGRGGNAAWGDDEFAAPPRRGPLYGAVGLGVVVLAGAAFWYFTRATECDRLTKRICVEGNTASCDLVGFSKALEKESVDDAKCVATMSALDAALEGVTETERPAAFDRALVQSLGFDPRGDDAPEIAAPKPEGPPPPSVIVQSQPKMSDMFVDRAHVYWTTQDPPGVFRVRNIGGEVEAFGNQADPIDVTPTKNFVYWISRGPTESAIWVDKIRGSHQLAKIPTGEFSPVRGTFSDADFAFIDGKTGAVMMSAAGGGAPRQLVAGRAPAPADAPADPAAAPPLIPTDILGDETHVFVAVPTPVATVWAVPRTGAAPALALATGQASPEHLAADATHVYWVESTSGTIVRAPRAGGPAEVVVQDQVGAGMLALDDAAVYWPNAKTGAVQSIAKAGGQVQTIATGLISPRFVAVDGAAIFWESGGAVYRQAR